MLANSVVFLLSITRVKGLDLTNILFSDPDRATAKGEGRDRATATVTGRSGGRDLGRDHLSA